MKKITYWMIALILSSSHNFIAQTYSTETITLGSGLGTHTAQFDITNTEVTLTLVGPSDRWLGLGFGVTSMLTQGDVVIYDNTLSGTVLTDRRFNASPRSVPSLDGGQNWELVTNDVSGSTRTIVATRDLDTTETGDYVFSAAAGSIDIVWARGDGATFTLGYHGGTNKGAVVGNPITLGIEDYELSSFKISPNPVSAEFNIELPDQIDTAKVQLFDILGKQLLYNEISKLNSVIDVTALNNGIYMVRVSNGNSSQTKRIIKH